jgi:acyl-coenzyme A thioesterase PaaI-like protein
MSDSPVPGNLLDLVQSPQNRCFGCGPGNDHGLHLRPERQGDIVVAQFTPTPSHSGWSRVVHGGILASALDETMAYALFLRGEMGMTARMEIRYRRRVVPGDLLTVEAWVNSESRRIADIQGRIRRENATVAEAKARFMKLGPLEPSALLAD